MTKKGLEGWIEIFRVPASGAVTDSQGRTHDGKRFLQKAVELFNPQFHEPPIVAGHPKDNAPAMGWVGGLKAMGNSLFALPKDVIAEFAELVEKGLYKKRSACFYQDGSLRHVGFLGAMPPAIKGLADIRFQEARDAEAITFEFAEGGCNEEARWGLRAAGRMFRRLREYLIEKEGVDTADRLAPEYEIQGLENMPPTASVAEVNPSFTEPGTPAQGEEGINMKTYTQEELDQKLKEVKEKATAEFAETQAREKARAELHTANVSFVEALPKDKLIPAIKTGLVEFMDALGHGGPAVFEFSEESDGAKKSLAPLDFFKNFLKGLPKSIEFSEVATRASDPGADAASAREVAEGRDIAKRAR